jgi:hypothetical protein
MAKVLDLDPSRRLPGLADRHRLVEQPQETALALAGKLAAALGLTGPGRIEVELTERGEVRSLWKHEKHTFTPKAAKA